MIVLLYEIMGLPIFVNLNYKHSVYNNLNHIINRIVFSITASLRFYDALHIYVTEFHTNFFSISIPTSLCPHISQLSLLEKPITNIFCSRNY
eukprot:bmy_18323T0